MRRRMGFFWLAVLLVLTRGVSPTGAVAAPAVGEARDAYVRMPLYFVATPGPRAGEVAYRARGGGASVALTAEGMGLALDGAAFSVRFAGAAPTQPVGGARQPATVHYLIGDDSARWRADLPTYAQVIYHDLYPGIDLYYEGADGALKYTVVVAPGADVDRVRLTYEGVAGLRLDRTGDLLIPVGDRDLRDTQPYAYQHIDGRRVPVDVAFELQDAHTVGFAVQGPYDPHYPLVIDPTLAYASYLGGSEDDRGWGIAIDDAGYLYVVGETLSTDFPLQGSYQGDDADTDVFVAKIDPSQAGAASLIYATYLGGDKEDVGYDIAVDGSGHAYVTGYTRSLDFPTTANAYQPTPYDGAYVVSGNRRAFVTKLNAAGNGLLYGTYLRYTTAGEIIGGRDARGRAIAVTSAGVAYVTGETHSPDFPTTPDAYQDARAGDGSTWDAFFVKLDTAQSGAASFLYGTYYGGSETERGLGIAVDGTGNAYITGQTYASPDLPTPNAYQGTPGGDWDAFVAKFGAAGDLLYGTYLGSTDLDWGSDVAVDGPGHAYVVGVTESSDFPTQGPYQAYQGGKDAFVVKLDTAQSGTASLVYATYLGGYDGDECAYSHCSIAVDGDGHAYVTGSTSSSYFPVKNPYRDDSLWSDVFVTQFNAAGDDVVYSTYLGGTGSDGGNGIVVDDEGNACVVGMTTSTRFFDMKNAYQAANAGSADAFIVVLGPERPDLSTSRKQVGPVTLVPTGTLTHTLHYTVTLANVGNLTAAARLTDTLPTAMDLIAGPTCPSGACGYAAGDHVITWTGSLSPASSTTLTYAGRVSVTLGTTETIVFVNTAQVDDGVNAPFTLRAHSAVNPIRIYLPLLLREA